MTVVLDNALEFIQLNEHLNLIARKLILLAVKYLVMHQKELCKE